MARVFIDGYNLLLGSGRGAGEGDRDELVREAARYRAGRSVEVTVFFDSRTGGGQARSGAAGVRVEFAHGEADRAIVEAVRRSRSPGDILVVTSDRRLAAEVRDLGARVEAGAAFGARAAKRSSRSAPAEKPPPPSKREIEEWLRVFGEDREEDPG